MDNQKALLIAGSMGTAAASYVLFAAYLVSLGQTWRNSKRARAMLTVIVLSALWASVGTLFALSSKAILFVSGSILDILRYGAWYVFLILLLSPAEARQRKERVFPAWLIPLCWVTVIGGIALYLAVALELLPAATWARAQLLQALGMIVLALILLEQLFRNVTDDARWNVKPLCLALLGQFGFDLFLYSDALLFNQIDVDAYAIRGFVHALVIPLLLVATVRSRDWTAKIRLSQKAAFHTATLLIAAIYLLFMAAVGYYVRFFGGDWGRALQISLLFASLLFLGLLGFSGSMRARLRVLVGKHFFS